MDKVLIHLPIAVIIGGLCGFLTYRNTKRREIEEDPRFIGSGAGVIAGLAYLAVAFFVW